MLRDSPSNLEDGSRTVSTYMTWMWPQVTPERQNVVVVVVHRGGGSGNRGNRGRVLMVHQNLFTGGDGLRAVSVS
jgi:hypothetical protein